MWRVVRKPLGIITGMVALLFVATYAWYWWFIKVDVPKPISDVPVTYKIGWWPDQKALRLERLSAIAVFDELNVFNGTSVIEYSMQGTLSNQKGWRPYIRAIHLSERWEEVSAFEGATGSVVVTPIVGVEEDSAYAGERIGFDISVQDYLDVAGWGRNTYYVSSLGKYSIIKLRPRK